MNKIKILKKIDFIIILLSINKFIHEECSTKTILKTGTMIAKDSISRKIETKTALDKIIRNFLSL
jgi:hypothetical protein